MSCLTKHDVVALNNDFPSSRWRIARDVIPRRAHFLHFFCAYKKNKCRLLLPSRVKGDTEYNNLLINHCYRDRKWMNESRSKTATVVAKKKAEIRYWQWFLFDCSEGSVWEKENCLNALPKIETKTVSSSSLRMTLQIATDFNLSQAQLARRRRTDKYWPKQKHDLLCECFLFPFAYPKKPGPGPKKGEAGRLKAIIMKSWAENEENMFTESYVLSRCYVCGRWKISHYYVY